MQKVLQVDSDDAGPLPFAERSPILRTNHYPVIIQPA
jgi:hypothetical protein